MVRDLPDTQVMARGDGELITALETKTNKIEEQLKAVTSEQKTTAVAIQQLHNDQTQMNDQIGELGARTEELGARTEERFDKLEAHMKEIADLAIVLKNSIKNQKKPIVGDGPVTSKPKGSSSRATLLTEEEAEGPEPLRAWVKKVELPTFEGNNPLGWISRAEKFFQVQKVQDQERMRLAYICMEGDANHWFQFWADKVEEPTWDEFVKALIERFDDCAHGSVYERLSSITQKGSVAEFFANLR